jgi:hypothetical protein
VITCATTALCDLWAAFGPIKIKTQIFLPHVGKGASNTNPAVRKEALECCKSLYRWMGEATIPTVEKLIKPA